MFKKKYAYFHTHICMCRSTYFDYSIFCTKYVTTSYMSQRLHFSYFEIVEIVKQKPDCNSYVPHHFMYAPTDLRHKSMMTDI